FGAFHADLMRQMPYIQAMIALVRDGFHAQSSGGQVSLKRDGSPSLDYPISDFLWDGMRRALLSMAQIQFAAGAKMVLPVHEQAVPYRSWTEAKAAIERLPMAPLRARVVSAHVMGGCGMGSDPERSVVDGRGTHHQVGNLSVFDGSVFPTSIGANPQLSIYGLTARNASILAAALTGKPAPAIA